MQWDLAEAALGPLSADADAEWLATWITLQQGRITTLYWLGETDELEAVVQRVRPVVEERGTATQRGELFAALTILALRRDRVRCRSADGRVRTSRPGRCARGRQPRDDRVAAILARIHAAVGCTPRRGRDAPRGSARRSRPHGRGQASLPLHDLPAGGCTKARRRAGGEPGRRRRLSKRPEWRSSPNTRLSPSPTRRGWRGERATSNGFSRPAVRRSKRGSPFPSVTGTTGWRCGR